MTDHVGFGYLEKLVGNTVTVFKGGPHSDMGVVEAVREDYLVLNTEDKGYVYYPFKHLKRVIDNTKNQTKSQTLTDETSEESELRVFPDTFLELIQSLQMKVVHVNGGKHPSNQGYLIDAKSEFIAYSSEKEGLVFFRLDHIKSLSATEVEGAEALPAVEFDGDHSFSDVLGVHLHKWTMINEGPDKVEGVLVDVNDSFTILVKNEEIIYVANESIHFIRQKVNHSNGDKDKSDKNDQSNEVSNEASKETQETNNQSNETSTSLNGSSKSATIKRMIIENLAKSSLTQK